MSFTTRFVCRQLRGLKEKLFIQSRKVVLNNYTTVHFRPLTTAAIRFPCLAPSSGSSVNAAAEEIKTENEYEMDPLDPECIEAIKLYFENEDFDWTYVPGNIMKEFHSKKEAGSVGYRDILKKQIQPVINVLTEHDENEQFEYYIEMLQKMETSIVATTPQEMASPSGALLTMGANVAFNSTISQEKRDAGLSVEEKGNLAAVLGWCTEITTNQYWNNDDRVDDTNMRYGRPCWIAESVPSVDVLGFMPQTMATNALLHHYFSKDEDKMCSLMDLFAEALVSLEHANDFECYLNSEYRNNGTVATMEQYFVSQRYQNGYAILYLPVGAACILNDITDWDIINPLEAACLEVVLHMTMIRDYMDYWSLDQVNCDIKGTDIAKGRLSWPFLTALGVAKDELLEDLKDNYGKNEPDSIAIVKDIYGELEMPRRFIQWEKNCYNNASKMIQELSDEMPRAYIQDVLESSRDHVLEILK